MKLILACLLAVSFAACTPKSDDDADATPSPQAATPVPPPVVLPPTPAPGAWMWKTKDGKTPRPGLNVSDDPFNQKPHR